MVEGDGVADVDEIVVRFAEPFLGHKLFLIQLFAGAKAGVHDLDILPRLESSQFDEVSSQGVDLDGPTHIQHEYLSAVGVGAGQHHQAHRLGDGHKVANDVRVGHGDRAALGDLPLEQRDHGAVAPQHVAEADRHELGLDVLEHSAGAVLIRVLLPKMGEQLGDISSLALLDLGVEALNDHLAKPLTGAHHVGGVHRLVRGDEHESLTAVDHGGVGGLIGADGVVLDGLAGTVLHEGHVLMSRRMIDDLGAIGIEHLEDPSTVPNGPDESGQLQTREVGFQLQLDIVGVVLVDIEYDELLGIVGRDLPAELAADGATAARDHDRFTVDERKNPAHVGMDGRPAQQILHGHVLHGADRQLSGDQLVHARQLLELAVGAAADIQNLPFILRVGAGDGQKDLVHMILLHVDQDIVSAAHHQHTVHVATPLVGVVVDDAYYLVLRFLRQIHVPQDHLSCVSGADEHDPPQSFLIQASVLPLMTDKTIEEPDPHQESRLSHGSAQIVGNGHAPTRKAASAQQGDAHSMDHGGKK